MGSSVVEVTDVLLRNAINHHKEGVQKRAVSDNLTPKQVHRLGPELLYINVHTGPRQEKEPGPIVSCNIVQFPIPVQCE